MRDLAYKGVSALCVLTKHDLAYYSRFVRRCELIYNPFFGLNSSSKKENVILSVARLEPVKDYDTYFRALSLIDSAILRNYKIKIAGSGSLETQLKQKASNLCLEIEFLGHVKDIAPLYQKAKIIVLSSLFEGLPNVLIEAAFYDCARLASDTSGAKELITSGFDGFLSSR